MPPELPAALLDDVEDLDDIPDDEDEDDGEPALDDDETNTIDIYQQIPLPHLREISSLASWTVSSHKPGCGSAALRNASPLQYWQSDGPQPHTLNIHFFKLVSIAHIRILLDFEQDESYTPTKMQFLAGTGHHDLQLVKELNLETPKGWLDVDLSRAGGPTAAQEEAMARGLDKESAAEYDDDAFINADEDLSEAERDVLIQQRKIGRGPCLRCFLLQVRILENHQNGKDTHLRGLQIFSRDAAGSKAGMARKSTGGRPVLAAGAAGGTGVVKKRDKGKARQSRADRMLGIPEDAFGEPVIR